MASSTDYLEFVLENLCLVDGISFRKMMGEYIIYRYGKVIGGIYDNRFLIKPTKRVEERIKNIQYEIPYKSGKPMILVDEIENREFLKEIVEITYENLR